MTHNNQGPGLSRLYPMAVDELQLPAVLGLPAQAARSRSSWHHCRRAELAWQGVRRTSQGWGVTRTHLSIAAVGTMACRSSTGPGLPSANAAAAQAPCMHCPPWGDWVSHTQLQQFGTGINTRKAFFKEKNSLRPKAEGKHGLNILTLCAERVQMLPLTVQKAHGATVKSFKTSKLRLVSRHDCTAFKRVTHRGTCSWARCA